jgi:nucleotide-binding universal stress UspA family protein
MRPIRSLLAATDFSDCSTAALDAAGAWAKALGAELHLLHAFELPVPRVMAYDVPVSDLYIQQGREVVDRRLREEADRIAATGVPVQTHLRWAPTGSWWAHTAAPDSSTSCSGAWPSASSG